MTLYELQRGESVVAAPEEILLLFRVQVRHKFDCGLNPRCKIRPLGRVNLIEISAELFPYRRACIPPCRPPFGGPTPRRRNGSGTCRRLSGRSSYRPHHAAEVLHLNWLSLDRQTAPEPKRRVENSHVLDELGVYVGDSTSVI